MFLYSRSGFVGKVTYRMKDGTLKKGNMVAKSIPLGSVYKWVCYGEVSHWVSTDSQYVNPETYPENSTNEEQIRYLKKEINITKKFKQLRLLTPSIKLKPLIKTKKKNDIIKSFKKVFCIISFSPLIRVSIVILGVSDMKNNNINN